MDKRCWQINKHLGGWTYGNTDPISTPCENWTRPENWIEIPSYSDDEEVFYGIHFVFDSEHNPLALLCNGTGSGYTVDWGDGNIVDYAFNVKASYDYDFSTISSEIDECGRKQVLVKVTPKSGATITLIDMGQRHGNYNYAYTSGFAEMIFNFSNANQHLYGVVIFRLLENIEFKRFSFASGSGSYAYFNSTISLRRVVANTVNPLLTNMSYLFLYDASTNVSIFELDLSNVTIFEGALGRMRSIKDLSHIDLSNATNLYYTLSDLKSCQKLMTIESGVVTNLSGFGTGMDALVEIPRINCASLTTMTPFLNANRQIRKSELYRIKITHSYASQMLSASALNEIFDNLDTVSSGQSITITGNPGASTCDTSIATSKGWTVIN